MTGAVATRRGARGSKRVEATDSIKYGLESIILRKVVKAEAQGGHLKASVDTPFSSCRG